MPKTLPSRTYASSPRPSPSSSSPRWRNEHPTIPAPVANRATSSSPGASSSTIRGSIATTLFAGAPGISSGWGDGPLCNVEFHSPETTANGSKRMATTPSLRAHTAASPSRLDGRQPADVFVVFGITGDLAKVMTFRSLYRLEKRGLLGCPVVGVAVDNWTAADLRV